MISTAAPALEGIRIVCPRREAARLAAVDDTLLAAYLIEPGRSTYELDDLAAEYGVAARSVADHRRGDGGTRAPCGAARCGWLR